MTVTVGEGTDTDIVGVGMSVVVTEINMTQVCDLAKHSNSFE